MSDALLAVDETTPLTASEARELTDEVRADAEALWLKLLRLYNGRAHLALGYTSWGSYFETEFAGSRSRGYQLLEAARVVESVQNFGLAPPKNDYQARELVPLLEQPAQLADAWQDVQERHGDTATAADVREAVNVRLGVHYSSATDEWSTPQELFDLLATEFPFELDVCATAENAKCATFYTSAEDGLAQPWTGVCWMNPPYGNVIGEWVRKAWQAANEGATVVCLVPARVDTAWWWDYARRGEIRFLRGRLRFGGGDTGAPFPSAVVIFGLPAAVVWWEAWK